MRPPDPPAGVDVIGDLLQKARVVAVVGLSPDPGRESYQIAAYLQQAGYEIVPVNPKAESILGRRSYPGLDALPQPPEVVQIFRSPEHVPAIVEAAIAIGAKAVWMQVGIRHDGAAERARRAGLLVVMDDCMRRHHRLRHAMPR